MPTFSDEPGFPVDARSLAAIESGLRRVLETDGRKPAERRHGHRFIQNCFLAKNGGTPIPARSGTTPGSGSVTLYKCDDTTLEAVTGSGATVTAYNLSGATVAADAYLMLVRIGNKLWVNFEDCGA